MLDKIGGDGDLRRHLLVVQHDKRPGKGERSAPRPRRAADKRTLFAPAHWRIASTSTTLAISAWEGEINHRQILTGLLPCPPVVVAAGDDDIGYVTLAMVGLALLLEALHAVSVKPLGHLSMCVCCFF